MTATPSTASKSATTTSAPWVCLELSGDHRGSPLQLIILSHPFSSRRSPCLTQITLNRPKDPVTCAVLTISDTRTEADDKSGKIIKELVEAAGHSIAFYRVVKDEADQIRALIKQIAEKGECHVILTNGGTGIAARDTTYEAVTSLLDKRLDGFGEVFRFLSWEDIGSGAMLSRAVAGVYKDTMIFCMPGSSGAVQLAMEKLIVP